MDGAYPCWHRSCSAVRRSNTTEENLDRKGGDCTVVTVDCRYRTIANGTFSQRVIWNGHIGSLKEHSVSEIEEADNGSAAFSPALVAEPHVRADGTTAVTRRDPDCLPSVAMASVSLSIILTLCFPG